VEARVISGRGLSSHFRELNALEVRLGVSCEFRGLDCPENGGIAKLSRQIPATDRWKIRKNPWFFSISSDFVAKEKRSVENLHKIFALLREYEILKKARGSLLIAGDRMIACY
jgi:hypothetical protein